MLTLADAQARLLALAPLLSVERVPPAEALGRYLANPLTAGRTQPPADLSAMDGYAVRSGDLPGPWQVVGNSACGHPFDGQIGQNQAVRIATGALMPNGADMILIQEDTDRTDNDLHLTVIPADPPARNVRRKGMDFAEGDLLLPEGARIGTARLALAIAAGHSHVAVRRAPQIAVIDSGDELSDDPRRCALHQIPASNSAMIVGLVQSAIPCQVTRIGPVPDKIEALADALAAAGTADVVVTSGGASAGDHDLIQPALECWGAELAFWKVAMKPGKPVLVARRGKQVVVGLPGNPVSSYVTAYLLLLPLLRAMLGAAEPLPRQIMTVTRENLPAGGLREEFLRGWWDGQAVTALVNQDSGALGALAASNALIVRPINAPEQPAGTVVSVYLLENGGIA